MRQEKSAALKFRQRCFGGLSFQRQPSGGKQNLGLSFPSATRGINKLVVVLRCDSSQEQCADMHRPEARGPLQPLQAPRNMFGGRWLSTTVTTQSAAVHNHKES